MTSTWKFNEVVLAEAPTYEHKFHRFRPNIWKSGKYKNRILKQCEYKIKTENAGLFYRRTELMNFFGLINGMLKKRVYMFLFFHGWARFFWRTGCENFARSRYLK